MTEGEVITLRCPPPTEQLSYGDLILPQGIPTEFMVNKTLLCWYSAFFRGCFETQGTKLSLIEMEDVNSAVLQSYIFYMYRHQIRFADGEKPSLRHMPLLIDLYIFADKYDTVSHRNEILKEVWALLVNHQIGRWPWAAIGKAFDRLPVTAMLYKLLMTKVCAVLVGSDRDRCSMIIAHLPPEAAVSVMHYLASDNMQRATLCPQYDARITSSVKMPKEYLERKE